MNRHQLVEATYAAGKRLNRIKAEYGLIPARQAAATERRIESAQTLLAEIDILMSCTTAQGFAREMARLRPAIEQANMSTVCDKRELNVDITGPRLNYGAVAHLLVKDVAETLRRRLSLPLTLRLNELDADGAGAGAANSPQG